MSYRKILAIGATILLSGLGYMVWSAPYPLSIHLIAVETGATPFAEKLFFPVGTFEPGSLELDYYKNRQFSQELFNINEDSFSSYPSDQTLFRLTVAPSFMSAYAFRLTKKDGTYTLLFKTPFDEPIYDPEQLQKHKETILNQHDADSLIAAFSKIDVCNLPKDNMLGYDGSNWLFETYKKEEDNTYSICYADYWSPFLNTDETRKAMVEFHKKLATLVRFS